MQDRVADLRSPSAAHRVLEQPAGSWSMLYRVWIDPNGPPLSLPAEADCRMIFGGRYLRQEMKGSHAEGLGLEGYDNVTQQYSWVWIDSSNTHTLCFRGSAEESGRVLTYEGDIPDPVSRSLKRARVVIRILSSDRHTFEFLELWGEGQDRKLFDITYTRKA